MKKNTSHKNYSINIKLKELMKFSHILIITSVFLSSCKIKTNEDKLINNDTKENINESLNSNNSKMEIRFSCGEDGISKYKDDGWKIVEEYSQEKICTWKSVPATEDCDMEKDKGCKITKPDKIGEERIYY